MSDSGYQRLTMHKRSVDVNANLTNGTATALEDESSSSSRMDFKISSGQRHRNYDHVIPVPSLSFSVSAFVVFLTAILCFCVSYDGDFIFDDRKAIKENKDLLPETPLSDMFWNDFWGQRLTSPKSHKSYRPITVLSFRLSYFLGGGLKRAWFHVPNILLHGINSVLLLRVFAILFCGNQTHPDISKTESRVPKSALLCSLLFAVHPIHTECVAGLVGRADLLCALLFLVSFLLYIKSCSTDLHEKDILPIYRPSSFSIPYILGSMLVCFLSVFCKEHGLTVLGICSVYDIVIVCNIHPLRLIGLRQLERTSICERNGNNNPKVSSIEPWIVSLIKRHVFLLTTGLLTLGTRLQLMGPHPPNLLPIDNPHSFENDTFIRALNYNYVYSLNAWLLVHPWWLCCDWSMGCVPIIKSILDLRILGGVAVWGVLGTLLFTCFKTPRTAEQRVLTVAVAFIIVPFLPASNLFFRVGFVVAERILYLPSIGFCMLVVLGVRRICATYPTQVQAVKIAITFLICIFMIRCVQRSLNWKTTIDLFTSSEHVCPLNAKIHYSIGWELSDVGKLDEAVERYRLAIKLNPQYHDALNNLGVLLRDRKDLEESESLLERAVEIKKDFGLGWTNLGLTKEKRNNFHEAETCYLTAITLRPKDLTSLYYLGRLYYNNLKMPDKAVQVWWNATVINPKQSDYWYNIAAVLYNQEKYKETTDVLQKALTHVPGNPRLLSLLALVYKKQGSWETGEKLYLEAIKMAPRDANVYVNLGILYEDWKKYDLAEKYYRDALDINPNATGVRGNLQNVLQKMGRASVSAA